MTFFLCSTSQRYYGNTWFSRYIDNLVSGGYSIDIDFSEDCKGYYLDIETTDDLADISRTIGGFELILCFNKEDNLIYHKSEYPVLEIYDLNRED